MPRLISAIDPQGTVRNIIFDFGNVICDIDIKLTEAKFHAFGPAKSGQGGDAETAGRFEHLVSEYEAGKVSSEEFRAAIRTHYVLEPSDDQIDDAWNALLGEIPTARIRLLESLRPDYRLFLLSNSNEIHYRAYIHEFRRKSGLKEFDQLFNKAYFSFQMGITKPSPEIFRQVIREQYLLPEETVFIDDTLNHVESARSVGLHGVFLPVGTDVCSLFI